MMRYWSQENKCALNWFQKTSFPSCTNMTQIRSLQKRLQSVKTLSMTNLTHSFGCYVPCSKKYHRLVSVAKRAITWDTPWVSEVFVFLKYVHYQKKTEYYTYDGVKRVISHLVLLSFILFLERPIEWHWWISWHVPWMVLSFFDSQIFQKINELEQNI